MRVINFMVGFLGGLVIGVAMVLLTAPQSGTDFQAEIRARFDDIMQEGRKAASARRSELEDKLASLRT